MSEQIVDPRSAWAVLRRNRRALAVALVLGALAAGVPAFFVPGKYTSTSEVLFPAVPVSATEQSAAFDIDTQVLIAGSDVVTGPAGAALRPPLSAPQVDSRIKISAPTANVVRISAVGATRAEAEALAGAVAAADVEYSGGGAAVIQRASPGVRTPLVTRAALLAALGAGVALLVTALILVRRGRRERALRSRDQIAEALGVPVVASLRSRAPRTAAGWASLLQSYAPDRQEMWTLRQLLRLVTPGTPGSLAAVPAGGPRPTTVVVVTLSDDHAALAVGPQLAAFAASSGAVTRLDIAAAPPGSAAALRAASSRFTGGAGPRPGLSVDVRKDMEKAQLVGVLDPATGDGGRLQAPAADPRNVERADPGDLVVCLAVTDRQRPDLGLLGATDAVTLLAVTSGAGTADDLARVAVAADDAGHSLAGIVVADPDPLDRTSGRLAPADRGQHLPMPSRVTGAADAGEVPAPAKRRRPG